MGSVAEVCWRPLSKPPSPGSVARWLTAQPRAGPERRCYNPADVAAQAARLIAAPYHPRSDAFPSLRSLPAAALSQPPSQPQVVSSLPARQGSWAPLPAQAAPSPHQADSVRSADDILSLLSQTPAQGASQPRPDHAAPAALQRPDPGLRGLVSAEPSPLPVVQTEAQAQPQQVLSAELVATGSQIAPRLHSQPPSQPLLQQQQQRRPAAPCSAAPAAARGGPKTLQAVLVGGGRFAAPLPAKPAWSRPALSLSLASGVKSKSRGSAAAVLGGSGRGGSLRAHAHPAEQAEPGDGAAPAAPKPAAKRRRKEETGGGPSEPAEEAGAAPRKTGKAGRASLPGPAAPAVAFAERLDLEAPGVVSAVTPEGFAAFAGSMAGAASCSIGVLLADSTGSQFYSTLEPLSKEQLQRIKAGAGKKPRLTTAGAASAPASAGGGSAATGGCGAHGDSAVALCLLPIHLLEETAVGPGGGQDERVFLLPLAPRVPGRGGAGGVGVSAEAAAQGRDLAGQLLRSPSAIVCFNMQDVLRLLRAVGVAVPPPRDLRLVDPGLLGWLAEPQLVQRGERERIEGYSLAELAARHLGPTEIGPGAGGGGGGGPLARLAHALGTAKRLGEALHGALLPLLPVETIQREMQVAAVLAEMEGRGLGFDPWLLRRHGDAARAAMQRLEREAAALAGRAFNLSSAVQVSEVLYRDLRLPPPAAHSRSAAKTHLPTDEHALRQLAPLSPLPGIVLAHRALQNFLSKWVDAGWARAAGAGASAPPQEGAERGADGGNGGGDWPRVRCRWHQTSTATGRLSSSAPNLQAVTKYDLELEAPGPGPSQQEQQQRGGAAGGESAVPGGEAAAPGGAALTINIRDAFVARRGAVLLSADYSQVELRVLAHLSGDSGLVALLRRAGPSGDAFRLIASSWLGSGDPEEVHSEDREKAKRVCYAIIYGISAWGLAQGSGALGVSVQAAQDLISSFLRRFPGVARWMEDTRAAARQDGRVVTLAGRARPLAGLDSEDKRVRGEAERKAINTTIQGTAADLIKAAMVAWHDPGTHGGRPPPAALLAQIHDELIFEVEAGDVAAAAAAVRATMEGVVQLEVPLAVNIKAGERWGSLVDV